MPFTKTHQPFEQFVLQFTKDTEQKPISGEGSRLFPMLPLELFTGETADFMVRYYKRSGESSAEDVREYYPCIILQDFAPEIDSSMVWDKDWIEGFYDEVRQKRDKVYLPIPMTYKFQVSAVTKRKKESSGVNDWFLANFISNAPNFFEMNRFESSEGVVADIVPYSITATELERDDGRFETVYDFMLKTFIHAKAKSYIFVSDEVGYSGGNFEDTLEKLTVALEMGNLKNLETVLQHEFYLE